MEENKYEYEEIEYKETNGLTLIIRKRTIFHEQDFDNLPRVEEALEIISL